MRVNREGCAPCGSRVKSGAWSTLPTGRGELRQACFVACLPSSPGHSCLSGLACTVINDEARLDDEGAGK